MTQLAIPHLEKTKGNIVNVSSIASFKAVTRHPSYNLLHLGLDVSILWHVESRSRSFRSLLFIDFGAKRHSNQQSEVRFLLSGDIFSPGGITTDIGNKTGMTKEQFDAFVEHVTAMTPMARFGTSEEMATTILFMATDATYMTGRIDNVWKNFRRHYCG